MDKQVLKARSRSCSVDVAAQHSGRLLSEDCAAMHVTYLARMAEVGQERACNEIEILIPGDQGAFHAVYRTADGLRQLAFVRAPLISVIPANQPHAISCEQQSDLLVIALDQNFFKEKAREALGSDVLDLVARYAALDPLMREVGNALRSEFRMLKTPSAAYLEPLAEVIAIHVAENYSGATTSMRPHAGLPPHKLNLVQAFIRDHLAEPIRVEQLAAAVHTSPYHFARMFKQATGQPPHVYIVAQRLERAKDLLSDSVLPLIEVGARVGFRTQGHFTGVFHRYVGLTPRNFRLNCRAAPPA
jgi:AraC family transcriptional regulator